MKRIKTQYIIIIILLFLSIIFANIIDIQTSPTIYAIIIISIIISTFLLFLDKKPFGFFKVTNLEDKILLVCKKEHDAIELINNSNCETKVTFVAFKDNNKKEYSNILKNINKNH